MGTVIQMRGAIDRHEQDPSMPHDPCVAWIGTVAVVWSIDDRNRQAVAAIRKVTTGRGVGDQKWGPSMLCLKWLGDPPPVEIAQTVYDVINDGGPAHRDLGTSVESQPSTLSQPSYRALRV